MRQFQARWWKVIDGPAEVPEHVEAELCSRLSERVSDAVKELEENVLFSGMITSSAPAAPPLTIESLMETYRALAEKVVRIKVGPGQTEAFMSALEAAGAERVAEPAHQMIRGIPIVEHPYLPAGSALVTRGPEDRLLTIIYFKDGKVTSCVDVEQIDRVYQQAWLGK